MRAKYGEQSTMPLLHRWHRESRSNPDGEPYEIQLHADGILTCNCRGWINHSARSCTHVKDLLGEAQRFLDAMNNEQTVNGRRSDIYSGLRERIEREKKQKSPVSPGPRGRKIVIGSGWVE